MGNASCFLVRRALKIGAWTVASIEMFHFKSLADFL